MTSPAYDTKGGILVPDHPIVHIEIPATNTSAAGKFYNEVFGWKIEADQMYGYVQFQSEGGPGGGFVEVGKENPVNIQYKPDSLLVYLGSDDIDATLATIEAHGGKTVLPKTEIPHVGWWAVFTDPSGNRLALFTSAQHR
jgi:predicted enzyme related to lactoylglutathione lyase